MRDRDRRVTGGGGGVSDNRQGRQDDYESDGEREMSKINIKGWLAFEKMAEAETSDGRSALCTGRFDKACTYCKLYFCCPCMRESEVADGENKSV